ncbi:hypothetical protein EYF80_051314 [Liparis tanakae]|uniref:Uncharacterized protein n=1 Tax=Liparis tanakae TaxID=230148 RepID=A0A4Z2FBG5_9TELE|nr:hypothetical protein EYF80_051314 [Liparis tanakae]
MDAREMHVGVKMTDTLLVDFNMWWFCQDILLSLQLFCFPSGRPVAQRTGRWALTVPQQRGPCGSSLWEQPPPLNAAVVLLWTFPSGMLQSSKQADSQKNTSYRGGLTVNPSACRMKPGVCLRSLVGLNKGCPVGGAAAAHSGGSSGVRWADGLPGPFAIPPSDKPKRLSNLFTRSSSPLFHSSATLYVQGAERGASRCALWKSLGALTVGGRGHAHHGSGNCIRKDESRKGSRKLPARYPSGCCDMSVPDTPAERSFCLEDSLSSAAAGRRRSCSGSLPERDCCPMFSGLLHIPAAHGAPVSGALSLVAAAERDLHEDLQ